MAEKLTEGEAPKPKRLALPPRKKKAPAPRVAPTESKKQTDNGGGILAIFGLED